MRLVTFDEKHTFGCCHGNTTMRHSGHSIGAAARRTGVKVPTIRFYEQIGLLFPPQRTASNRRLYEEPDLKRLTFIRHARDLGFSVEDIRQLLAMTEQTDKPCGAADDIARRHLDAIDRKIGKLRALRSELRRMLESCDHGRIRDCHIVKTLADHGQCRHEPH